MVFINRGNSRIVPRFAGSATTKQEIKYWQTLKRFFFLIYCSVCLTKQCARWASSGHLFSAPWWQNRLTTYWIIHRFGYIYDDREFNNYVGSITFSKDEFKVTASFRLAVMSSKLKCCFNVAWKQQQKNYWNLIFPINLPWQVSWSSVICGYYNW